jgi:3-oxoacid CoA-transferase subunit A
MPWTRDEMAAQAATCGKVCVAEVEEIAPVGSFEADAIHLPDVYVQRVILGAPYDKQIEFRTVRERAVP